MLVAIQGEKDSFHDIAARKWFGPEVATLPADNFPGVFKLLEADRSSVGVVAIENTLYGGINQVYDLIEQHNYPIVGEIHLPIHHQLLGTPGQTISHIYSHPVALSQCEIYISNNYPDAKIVEYHDTAAAAELIKQSGNLQYAAIASREAGQRHNLAIIDSNIEDNPENYTRFLVIQPCGQPPANANRTSLVLTTSHQPGALAKILTILADQQINLSKLQSRPIIGRPWQYKFYLVLDTAGEPLQKAISDIKPLTQSLKILGQYRHQI